MGESIITIAVIAYNDWLKRQSKMGMSYDDWILQKSLFRDIS